MDGYATAPLVGRPTTVARIPLPAGVQLLIACICLALGLAAGVPTAQALSMRSHMHDDTRLYCIPQDSCHGQFVHLNSAAGGFRHQEPIANSTCPIGWKLYRRYSDVPTCDSAYAKVFLSTSNWTRFAANEFVLTTVFFISMYILGWTVEVLGWSPSLTRKAFGLVILSAPVLLTRVLPYDSDEVTVAASVLISTSCLLLLAEHFRSRSKFLTNCFMAIDRPEDRPFTLTWLLTGNIVAAALLMLMLWKFPNQPALIYIAFLSVVLGDIVAGAVGYAFGTHSYSTSALFTDVPYSRTAEGSAALFITTLAVIFCLGGSLQSLQYWAALCILPLGLTLAEALSPHTWDEPAMMLMALIVVAFIVSIGVPASA